jgi:hypothetical protein
MGKGRFLNQKLGKRSSHRAEILKAQRAGRRRETETARVEARFPKKGASREEKL